VVVTVQNGGVGSSEKCDAFYVLVPKVKNYCYTKYCRCNIANKFMLYVLICLVNCPLYVSGYESLELRNGTQLYVNCDL